MRTKWIATLMLTAGFVGVGCAKDGHHDKAQHSMGKADACAMCPGDQVAKADGTCPACGMNVSGMRQSPAMDKGAIKQRMPTTRSSDMSDACPACPGDQMLTANGTCPGCGDKPM